ncbi:conserved Plasmodium protein, unknown function [Plasmodium gallinaceum]|uniref:RanBP2-type domain-containing protein n=1 Tax=Plasmodium gallinaceum TaxID=5849 RepID=A0A1J1GLD5_PLAGA|nr:conserved Plasmodium protein, unknown function [Plasmodium gallinaceum]CRG93148.1 conserved Plasmodium protein, unknown function [Plasmodium gallinaceum]
MKKKCDKNNILIKSHKSKIKHYDKKKSKEKYKKHDKDASSQIYKGTKSNKKISKNYPTNLTDYNKNTGKKNSEISYNSYDYFDKNASDNGLSSNYINEQKLKYEKEVFEKAYGLSLDDDICYDNFLFKKDNGNLDNKNNKKEDSKKYYECFSCKTKNYYSNIQCYKCKKLRKL